MKRLLPLSVPLLALAIAGCGEESDQLPVDGRDFDGEGYQEPAPYQGRVIDGYLNNARVWLDLDGNGRYTSEPFTLQLANGNRVDFAGGEPMAMSGQDGAYVLDLSSLQLPPETGRSLDPRDYPLYAAAIPGTTVEQTPGGDRAVETAYLLAASPGVTNITPLTTLEYYLAKLGLGLGHDVSASLVGINTAADYILGQDERAHAYARALVRFMTLQVERSVPGGGKTELSLSPAEARLLAISLLRHAPEVIAEVDRAAAGDYARVAVDTLGLPEVTVSLVDPVVLTGQAVMAHSETGQLPARDSALELSTVVAFEYAETGRLSRIVANGCLMPFMPGLLGVIEADGYLADLATPWLPAVALGGEGALGSAAWAAFDPEADPQGVEDEALAFDWDNKRITFDTSTLCHAARGLAPASSELDGQPEVIYEWTMQDDVVAELAATIVESGDVYTLAGGGQLLADYELTRGSEPVESLTRTGAEETCEAEPAEDARGPQHFVVTKKQPYEFVGQLPAPVGFDELALEYDTRVIPEDGGVQVDRLLRWVFSDPEVSEDGLQWTMFYDAVPDALNPNLIRTAYLSDYTRPLDCGKEQIEPTTAYAKVEYEYQKLSDYLLSVIR